MVRVAHSMYQAGGGRRHVSYSLNSLKEGYIGDYIGDHYRGY